MDLYCIALKGNKLVPSSRRFCIFLHFASSSKENSTCILLIPEGNLCVKMHAKSKKNLVAINLILEHANLFQGFPQIMPSVFLRKIAFDRYYTAIPYRASTGKTLFSLQGPVMKTALQFTKVLPKGL